MQLGASVTLDEVIELGLTAGPLRGIDTMDIPALNKLGRRFRQAGVTAAQTGGYCNLISTDEGHRRQSIVFLRDLLARAEAAGCQSVIVGGGHRDPTKPQDIFSAHADNWTDGARRLLAESCLEVLDGWSSETTGLVAETWVMTPLDSPKAARELSERVAHKNFGILYDPVNMMNLDRCFRTGDFIKECFEQFGENIRLVHVKDTLLKADSFTYHMAEVPIGDGNFNIGQLLKSCSDLPDTLPLILEHLPDFQAYVKAIARVRKIAETENLNFHKPRFETETGEHL